MEQAKLAEKPSLSLTRNYPVTPEKVWRAWTDPQALKRWWGPGGALKAAGGGTEPAFLHQQLFDEKVRDDHRRGWSESLVKLEQYLIA